MDKKKVEKKDRVRIRENAGIVSQLRGLEATISEVEPWGVVAMLYITKWGGGDIGPEQTRLYHVELKWNEFDLVERADDGGHDDESGDAE